MPGLIQHSFNLESVFVSVVKNERRWNVVLGDKQYEQRFNDSLEAWEWAVREAFGVLEHRIQTENGQGYKSYNTKELHTIFKEMGILPNPHCRFPTFVTRLSTLRNNPKVKIFMVERVDWFIDPERLHKVNANYKYRYTESGKEKIKQYYIQLNAKNARD